jgi:alpha-ketoglutarate-dependent taurine dioxygenase
MQAEQKQEATGQWQLTPLAPFGVVVTSSTPDADPGEIPVPLLRRWVGAHRVVVLRGFAPLPGEGFPAFCSGLGAILEWVFGAVNELHAQAAARNYLYTSHAVPFHWDGAFAGRVPHYIIFHCDAAPPPGAGGETLFCDTVRLRSLATPDQQTRWGQVAVTYTTEKIAHYGGSFTAPLLARHPVSHEPTIRFAEPVDDLNPVRLQIAGLPADENADLVGELSELLYGPAVCYAHSWRSGDLLLADNHALLHGRRAYAEHSTRQLRRVNIL